MLELVLANLRHRPARAAATIGGVALGVVLVLVTVGLARGMMRSTGLRESRTRAELLFQPRGSFSVGITAAPLALPVAWARTLAEVEGVAAATPVGRYVRSGARGLGFELVEGVAFAASADHASYPELTGLIAVEGRLPAGDRELVIDRVRARDHGLAVGAEIEILGQRVTVSGIFAPEVGARIKMPLRALQGLVGTDGKCSWILISVSRPELADQVLARIDQRFPGHQVLRTRDLPGLYERGLPSLTVFLDVVVALAVAVSALVVLLAMQAAVSERTREIGILRALGASRARVGLGVLREALLLGLVGVAAGAGAASLVQAAIVARTSLVVEIEPRTVAAAALVALLGSLLGALPPAWRAARRDPIEALAHD